MSRVRGPVTEIFFKEFEKSPFCEIPGPNGSRLYWYQFGLHVVIVQQHPEDTGGGWSEFVGSEHNNTLRTFESLRKLMEKKQPDYEVPFG